MFPMNRRPQATIVEYDSRGKRVEKRFENAYEGRRFYVTKFNAGKNPRVKPAE